MKLSPPNAVVLAVCLSGLVASAPAPQVYDYWENTPVCTIYHEQEWRNPKEEVYDGERELVTGMSCRVLKQASCTISKSRNWGKTTTVTMGMGGIAAFDVGKLLNLAGLPTFSYSWAKTKGQTTTTAVECPKGDGWSCGMYAQPKMVKATGEYRGALDKYGLCEDTTWDTYEVHSVVIKEARDVFMAGEGIEDGADINFGACLEDCDTVESCNAAKDQGLQLCPATDKPENWEKPVPTTDEVMDMLNGPAREEMADKINNAEPFTLPSQSA